MTWGLIMLLLKQNLNRCLELLNFIARWSKQNSLFLIPISVDAGWPFKTSQWIEILWGGSKLPWYATPSTTSLAIRPVAVAPPKSAKRSTFSHKVGQKWGFCRRVRGVRFKKVHFLGPKGPLLGVPHPPKIDPGYGPAGNIRKASKNFVLKNGWNWSYFLRAWTLILDSYYFLR